MHHILNVRGWIALLIVGLIVFAEDALFVGSCYPDRQEWRWR